MRLSAHVDGAYGYDIADPQSAAATASSEFTTSPSRGRGYGGRRGIKRRRGSGRERIETEGEGTAKTGTAVTETTVTGTAITGTAITGTAATGMAITEIAITGVPITIKFRFS